MIYQKSFDSGILPQDWRNGHVIPIFKKGCRKTPGNYRPVSLTSVVVKVFESVIRDAMITHLLSKGLYQASNMDLCQGGRLLN